MTRWFGAVGLGAMALILVTACGSQPTPQATPAQDRPTFVWIFSDP